MSDPNHPHDAANPQPPWDGSPDEPAGSQPVFGGSGGDRVPPQPQFGSPSGDQPQFGSPSGDQPQYGPPPTAQDGYGQSPGPGYGQPSPTGQPGYQVPGGFQTAGASPQGDGPGSVPPPGWGVNPGEAPGQPKKGGSKVPLIIGGSVVVILALIVGLNQVFSRGNPATSPTVGGPTVSQPGTSSTGAASAEEAVQSYFSGLAAADPDAIFNLVRDDLPDRTFLTKEVLAAATLAAPITNLRLTESNGSKYSSEIVADYTINSRTATQKFFVSQRDDRWYLNQVTANLYVESLQPAGIGLTVNGVQVPNVERIEVFPGGYTLATTNDTYRLSDDSVVVETLASSADVHKLQIQLSDSALKDFRSATRKKLESCEKPGSLRNASCGIRFREPAGVNIRDSSVSCNPSGERSIERMKVTVDSTDITIARGAVDITLKCSMRATNGTRYTGNSYIFRANGELSESGWKVTFS